MAVRDFVLAADPIEQNLDRPGPEAPGEDLAVVGEDLIGDPPPTKGLGEHGAHRLGRGPGHEPRSDAEPGVVIDPGDRLELCATGEHHSAHDVHLPKLHRPGALPAAVVLGPAPARLGIDQALAHQAAVDR